MVNVNGYVPVAYGPQTFSSFFLSSFFFLTICFFYHMLNVISTKLGQNDQWVSGYKITNSLTSKVM